MDYKGLLMVTSGSSHDVSDKFTKMFVRSSKFFNPFNHYILVKDDGPGMTETYIRQEMFKPFSSTKEKGFGIGLYQCKSMIEKMGGKILCSSKLNEGTVFCILLR